MNQLDVVKFPTEHNREIAVAQQRNVSRSRAFIWKKHYDRKSPSLQKDSVDGGRNPLVLALGFFPALKEGIISHQHGICRSFEAFIDGISAPKPIFWLLERENSFSAQGEAMSKTHRSIGGCTLQIEYLATSTLRPDPHNARKHSHRQIKRLMAGIVEFGFTNPILVDERLKVIAGHARLEAAKQLKMERVPCVRLEGLSEPQKTALAIADNKLADMSEFDPQALAAQLAKLSEIHFPTELTGFDTPEVDMLLAGPSSPADPADKFAAPDPQAQPVSRLGDLWTLGQHQLLTGDALDSSSYERLLGDRLAEMVFADPPTNLPIQRQVPGIGGASGETGAPELVLFLSTCMVHLVRYSVDGSIHFHCMGWRNLPKILAAGAASYSEFMALCVWNKTNGGKGALYRSKHELVLVYKNGTAPHVNDRAPGRRRRHRTDVWNFSDAKTLRSGRDDELALGPTVKPVSLIAEALLDCSKRGALILDPFAGFGTTILAAERTGRRAAAIEIDPTCVDTAIRRWQVMTGGKAVLDEDGRTFEKVETARLARAADHD